MAIRRGISLLDLINLSANNRSQIPPDIETQFGRIAILEHRSVTTPDTYIHYGMLQSAADAGLPALRNWPVEAPGLNTGLPFRLLFRRNPSGSNPGDLEPESDSFLLDLHLDRVAIKIPGLRPARLIPSAGVTAAHLVPDTSKKEVRIVGGGILRIASNPDGGPVIVRFVYAPDPFDPDTPTGAVATVTFDPPHFFFGGSEYGLTVDKLLYDDSEEFTPSEIVARGQSAAWRGIAIKETTFYLPRNTPYIGDLSIGIRDVLLGSPFGVQGEVRVEFGQTPVDPALIHFQQQIDSTEHTLSASGSGNSRLVTLHQDTRGFASVRAHTNSGASAKWVLPDSREITGLATPYFNTRVGQSLSYRGVETDNEGKQAVSPAVKFRFKQHGAAPKHAPKINVTVDGNPFNNVVYLSGAKEHFANKTFLFAADPPAQAGETYTWELFQGNQSFPQDGDTFTPTFPTEASGSTWLMLTTDQGYIRRIKIEYLAEGEIVIGVGPRPRFTDNNPINFRAVRGTFDLGEFHATGTLQPIDKETEIEDATTIIVPENGLAEVTLELGHPENPDAPPNPPEPEIIKDHVQILMDFNLSEPLRWGEKKPQNSGSDRFEHEELSAWADSFVGSQFVIIGRCCDIDERGAAYNAELAQRRVNTAIGKLTNPMGNHAPVPPSQIFGRGEQSVWADVNPAGQAVEDLLGLTTDEQGPNWLIKQTFTDDQRHEWGSTRNHPQREKHRRVDIYAVYTNPPPDAPTEANDDAATDPALRRALIPGADLATVDAPAVREPHLPYRVLLVVRWDSPTAVEWSDAIPTLVELTLALQTEPVPIPIPDGGTQPVTASPEIHTIIGRYVYDARTDEMVLTAAWQATGGDAIATFETGDSRGLNALAATMALGPALMAGVSSDSIEGAAVRTGALAAAALAAAAFATDGKVIFSGFEVEYRNLEQELNLGSGSKLKLTTDYSVELGFDINVGFMSVTAKKPVRVRYKKVGFEVDNSQPDFLDRFSLIYDDVSFQIEDPGQWEISGPTGEFLRVAGARAGSGSTWFELDLAFMLDMGVIAISGATIRLTFKQNDVDIELRGLAVSVDIPGTLKGSGRMSLGEGGALRAGLQVEVIPAKVLAHASLAFDPAQGFFMLEVGAIFSVGIPLAASGLGLFGFIGRFVSNGARALPAGNDPIQREIDWYRNVPPENKYSPQEGQWAIGLGAVVGTMPDSAFTFNAIGMFAVEFPEPTVVFGIDAKFASRPANPSEQDNSTPSSFELLGLVVIDSSAVKIGVRGEYKIPNVFHLKVPISAYFPFSAGTDWYIRVGADGVNGRLGDPVTMTVWPDILNQRAWAYLMLEEKKLHRLGGDDRFMFDGFSIGFGAGWGIEWSAGPIKLSASAKLLVGIGTDPLMVMAGIFVRGELSLVVLSISAHGNITLKLSEQEKYLDGEFCGEVDMFFFSIKGCVGIHIGPSEPSPTIPTPLSPLAKVDLTDKRGRITGTAKTSGPLGDENTVWPDTVPVLHFSHYLKTVLTGSSFDPSPDYAGPIWSGTSELKYAFRLTGVDIVPQGGVPITSGDGSPLDSAWWLPTHRQGVMGSDPDAAQPSEHEGRQLALLSWHPAPWSRNLTPEALDDIPGDPGDTMGEICEPAPDPQPVCMLGEKMRRLNAVTSMIVPDEPSPPPFSSFFWMLGHEYGGATDLGAIIAVATANGQTILRGIVKPLLQSFNVPGSELVAKSFYRLPALAINDFILSTFAYIGEFKPIIATGELILVLCCDSQQTSGGERECTNFKGLEHPQEFGDVFDHDGLQFINIDPQWLMQLIDLDGNGNPELMFGDPGVRVILPGTFTTATVSVMAFTGSPIVVKALDSNGNSVDSAQAVIPDGDVVDLTVNANEIAELIVSGGGGEGAITEICYGFGQQRSSQQEAAQQGGGNPCEFAPPIVTGLAEADKEYEWPSSEIESHTSQDGRYLCRFVRYVPPEVGGPWQSIRVEQFNIPHVEVGIVSMCGITQEAQQAHDDDQQTRDDLADTINEHANEPLPERRHLLAADVTYQVRVRWQWQGWLSAGEGDVPPTNPDPTAWVDGPEDVYSFRTADEFILPADPEPVDFVDESQFDPRGIARYLLGFDPSGSGAPHFLDDPLYAHFEVDHLQQLLEQYDRNLLLKLRRTDPPPGSLHNVFQVPDIPIVIVWVPLPPDMWNPQDSHILDAIIQAPCLAEPPLGGSSAEITADLEPQSYYDLMLVAPPEGNLDSDSVLVTRVNFKTSRYRNSRELLDALGFTDPNVNPMLPHDALVDVLLPTDTILNSDIDFDQALADLGLDPWPLPNFPRTVVIWRNDGGWLLEGVMLETDEPLLRPNRLEISSLTVGSRGFDLRRSNAAGTRLLFVRSGNPFTPSLTDTIELTLTEPAGSVVGKTAVYIAPRVAFQESVS